jgi:isopenicillin N synthase-like dioxygenase
MGWQRHSKPWVESRVVGDKMSKTRVAISNLDDAPTVDSSAFGASIPVIDLDGDLGAEVIDEIAQACADWGSFQVVGHGVHAGLTQRLTGETRRFFGQSKDAKRILSRSRDNPWGFYDRELTKNVRDKKEIFDVGPNLTSSFASSDPFSGKTPWPAACPLFEQTIRPYFSECERLSVRLMEALCLGLAAPKDSLTKHFEPVHTSFLRLNYYPVADPLGDEHPGGADLGVHHHTDAGGLTLLLQDDVSGLQVYRDGAWYGVTPLKGAFVINVGDMIQVWSNDIYRAAIHRVLAMDRVDRYSLPFFFTPAYTTVVSPLEATVNDSRPARYHGIRWGEFRRKRADGDYSNHGPEVQISDYRI